ncbi:extracellular solute-binding protein [Paenibacillus sp. GCM10023248]|uniref:extracellular solute-binding protein n=1 Tax=unclassified Paenibacillus TaxID=185978 RepID=UPI002378C72D|nr:extracellular solute-binding protein [Paenibacillus sp. MAHUQ-63]MDD9271418.1 extracellular solute-binding protein [Paenibacillus sp. MAHUQ-63]
MKKTLKTTASVSLIAALFTLVAAACTSGGGTGTQGAVSTGTGGSSTAAPAAPSGFNYTGKGPITDKTAALSILATNAWTNNVDLNQAPIVQEISKRAGITVNWELLPPSTYQDAISPRLAAGADLPDIIYQLDQDQTMKNIQGGLFKPLNDYIEKYGVNIKKLFEKYPALKASLTTPDGKIYYLPQLAVTKNYMPTFMVNVRWLEKLGLQEPATLDEFTDMLRKFKSGDPNGNGKADEIPFSVAGGQLANAFGPVFGLDLANNFYADKDGKVHYSYYEPNYKEYLTYLNGLYKEGLLEPDFASVTADQITSKFSQNITGATFNFSWYTSMVYSKLFKDYDPAKPLIKGIAPFKGPHGDPYYVGRNPITGIFGVSKNAKDPELAFKFLDYASSEEAKEVYVWGLQGQTYEVVDGKKQFTEKGKDNDFIQKFGINPVNLPIEQSVEATDVLVAPWHAKIDKEMEKYIKAPFPFVYALPAEASTENTVMPDITTYVNEMNIKFITGKESLDKFDSYIKTLRSMGVEDVVKGRQAQYDRYLAAGKK